MEEPTSTKKRKPLWRRIVRIGLISFVVLLFSLFAAAAILLTPKRLTPIAERLADAFFIADVRFDTLRVSFFQEFPYVNLTIKNGQVRSRAFEMLPLLLQEELPPGCDSLLRFEELSVSLHLTKLLQSRAEIRRVQLKNAQINAYMSPYGIANWDVYLPDTTVVDKQEAESFRLNLQRLAIRDGFSLRYLSDPDSLSASLEFNRLFLKGDISTQLTDILVERFAVSGARIDAHLENKKISFSSVIDSLGLSGAKKQPYALFLQSHNHLLIDTLRYADELPITIKGGFDYLPPRIDSLFFRDFSISVADMPLLLNGSLVLEDPQPRSHLECRIDNLSLASMISLLPPSLIPELQDISTDIAAKIYAMVDYPAYTLDISTSGGHLTYPPANAYIHTLALDASYFHMPDQSEFSGIDLRKCDIEASGISLHAQGNIQNPLGDPNVNLSVQGDIQLDTLYRILPISEDVAARGAVTIDAKGAFVLSKLLQGDMKEGTLRGRVDAERLLLHLPKDSLLVMARGGHLSFGANQNQRDSLMDQGAQILRLSFRADSANIRYKRQFHLAMGNTRLSARSSADVLSGDSTRIHPFNGSFETGYLTLRMADSSHLLLSRGSSSFSLRPSPEDHSIPVIAVSLRSKEFQMSGDGNSYALHAPQISMKATQLRSAKESALRREARLDSLQALYPDIPRDSLTTYTRRQRTTGRVADELSSGDIDLEMDNDIKRLLRQWNLEGSIQADGGALSSPYFPIPVTLGSTDMEVSTEELHLMQTEIFAGRSQIECTGRISNLRQALLGRGAIGVYGFIRSDTLDVNELIQAANAGSQYASKGVVVADMEEASNLIIIPANATLDLKLFTGYTRYADLDLNDLSGSLTSRNRILRINDLEATSSAGAFTLSALYATRSKKDISAGFDLDMKDVKVERLISLIPSIDTLAPMLRSFEGVVNCQISATAAMDTSMNILLPTLSAACRIQGENMVLLDGETFTEISKTLRFKNRNRNLIEHIAVDFLIHDNKIEVFPFVIEMDRYRAAVSGIHNLDMSFNYHISVLHSPIPFRIGLDITGTVDNLHYKIGRCRYRDVNIPSYVEIIDATRVNLLKAIRAFDTSAAFQSVEQSVSDAAKIEPVQIEEEVSPEDQITE